MNIAKLLVVTGPAVGVLSIALAVFAPLRWAPLVGFLGFSAGVLPLVGHIIYQKVAPTAFTYAEAKMAGKPVVWVFREDKLILPRVAESEGGKLVVDGMPVFVDSPEDFYLLDNVRTAIMYRPIGKTLDPKKLLYIRELERLGYDRRTFMNEMEEVALRKAYERRFKEVYQELVEQGVPEDKAREEAHRQAVEYAKNNFSLNNIPDRMDILIDENGRRRVVNVGGEEE